MKCENCGHELAGAAIVCRQCNHNNAQGRVSQWRARRTGELPKPVTRELLPLSEKIPVQTAAENNASARFNYKAQGTGNQSAVSVESNIPVNKTTPSAHSRVAGNLQSTLPLKAASEDDDSGVIQHPAWRAQLKEKVRQVRERNGALATALETEPDEAQLDPNPIVESALKRIRWADHASTPAALPRANRHGSQSAALALNLDYDSEPDSRLPDVQKTKPESQASSPTKSATINPLMAHRPSPKGNHTETIPVAPRQDVEEVANPPKSEMRIELPPAQKTAANPFAVPKTVEPKVRTTGEIKRPQPAARVQPPADKSGNPPPVAVPPTHSVETQVIGLSPSVGTIAGYMTIGASTRPRLRTASLWLRILAGACDGEMIAIAFLPMFASYATLNTSLGNETYSLMFVLLAVLTFCYQLLTLTLADRTSGMALLQLRLVNIADIEKPISRSQLLARAAAATVAFICPPLNLIVIQSNHHRHSLPDVFSGTTLIERSSQR